MQKPQGAIIYSQTFEILSTGPEIYLISLHRKHLRQRAVMSPVKTKYNLSELEPSGGLRGDTDCTALPTGENVKNTDFLSDHFTLSVHSSDKS